MAKVDLKDAYFMIPIHDADGPLFRFVAREHHYQFTYLLFGLSCAPWVFTKTLKPVAATLRELGVRLVIYIDDILVIAESKDKARGPHLGPDLSVGEPGGYSSPRENSDCPHPRNRVLRDAGGLAYVGTVSTRTQAEEAQAGSSQVREAISTSLSTRSVSPAWQDEFSLTRSRPSPPLSQRDSKRPSNFPEEGQSTVRGTMPSLPPSKSGSPLVGRAADQVEWEGSGSEATRHADRV